MNAQILGFPGGSGTAPALSERRALQGARVQMDFATQLGKLERTLRWLDRHQIEVVAFACSTLKGARIHARGAGSLRRILREEMCSRGHTVTGATRIEQMEARDPSTGVLICWEEERYA